MTKTSMTMTVPMVMQWLREHLADFPLPYIANQFEKNGRVDFNERSALIPDRVQSEEDQKKRAQGVLDAFLAGFDGREGMNTLLCVLYSPLAVSSLVRAAYADTADSNRLAHVFVLRVGEVFILLLTASPYKRFPLDKFMKVGEHTSAFMWVNIKEACWEPYSKAASTLAGVQTPKKKKQKVFLQLSQVTLCGLHILSVFWRRAAVAPVLPPPVSEDAGGEGGFVYVQPPQKLTAVDHVPTATVPTATGEDAEDAPTVVPDAWVLKIERFADQFTDSTCSNTVAEAPPPAPPVVEKVEKEVEAVVVSSLPVEPVAAEEVVGEAMEAPLVV